YAVGESHEPGSTFKVMALAAALEDKVIDTSTIIDTKRGRKIFYGRAITDSHHGGYGEISAARVLEVSSNIGMATIIDEHYSENPEKFFKHITKWGLNRPLGISIIGEGDPEIPEPGHKKWSRNALPSMAYGYNLSITPLQTLAFYNAIANDGELVKPRFISAVKEYGEEIETFEKTVLNPQILSERTLTEIQDILKNVVVRGTGKSLYAKNFSMAGKTGTAQTEYWMKDWKESPRYISSFAGYFPAENPKYSCIVVIHKPSTKKGYYGADVSGPVFKRIAQKIYTDTPISDELESLDVKYAKIDEEFEDYYSTSRTMSKQMPDVRGMYLMDALSLLENMGLKVVAQGSGVVKGQSIKKGTPIRINQEVHLEI
ncbi:MAG: penicillin-binding transpeptidase domain-containing protein, partial [Flavobacteriaceae bacterium]|nr:penicillin-binding transpeptidase domain-containing protein [Flavobacteriaceae bacterium]